MLEEGGVEFVLIGGLAAALYGSPYVTIDADIVPKRDPENLQQLARVLEELEARVRAADAPDGLPFDFTAETLRSIETLNLTTRFGNLALAFVPSGTQGFPDLKRDARAIEIHGISVQVASLADVIRSKEAANREKDRLVLPTLRAILEKAGDSPLE